MNTYIIKVITMSVFTSAMTVLAVFTAPNMVIAGILAVAILVMHFFGLVLLAYLELRAEFGEYKSKARARLERLESDYLALTDAKSVR